MEPMQGGPSGSDVTMADARHDSPLPYAFGIVGTFAPLLVLWWSDPLTGQGFRAFHGWGLGASMLSGLVSACVGVLLRDSRRWAAFIAVALAFGTAFGIFVASASFPDGISVLPAVIPVAVLCALALVAVAAAGFASHRHLLSVRPRSLLAGIDASRVWTVAGVSVIGVAWMIDMLAFRASAARLAVAATAFAAVVATVIVRHRRIAELHAVMRHAGERVDERACSETLHDLGAGDDRFVHGPATEAYRTPGQPLLVIHGSQEIAQRRARQVERSDLAMTLAALLALLCMASLPAVRGFPERSRPRPAPAATPPGPPPVPTGPWYPDQQPILADIDHDGVEDVISLRWNEADPAKALFVNAYDGATFQPLWATKRIPSQWSSNETHLIRNGGVLFLTDSEQKLHIYDLATGRRLHPALHIDRVTSLCVPDGDKPGLWLLGRGVNGSGEIVDATGRVTKAQRPKHCKEVSPVRFFSSIGEWDSRCSRKLGTHDARSAFFSRRGDIGLGLGNSGAKPFAIGYDPHTCKRRWRSSLAFTSAALHPSPQLQNRLAGGRLYTLYQLESGRWEVGARDAKSGSELWHSMLPQAERGTDVQRLFVSAQRVYVARDWRLDVLALDDGRYLGRM